MQRQYETAIAQAQRAIDLNPGRANPHLGAVLNFAGRYEEAIQWLTKTIRLDPKGPAYYFIWLAHAYSGLGQYEAAIVEYKKALNRQPDYLFAHILLAAAYSSAGREEDARAEAAAVQRIDPNFSVERWRRSRSSMYKDQKWFDKAADMMRTAGLPE